MMRSMTKNALIELDRSHSCIGWKGGTHRDRQGQRQMLETTVIVEMLLGVMRDNPLMAAESTGAGWAKGWRET